MNLWGSKNKNEWQHVAEVIKSELEDAQIELRCLKNELLECDASDFEDEDFPHYTTHSHNTTLAPAYLM